MAGSRSCGGRAFQDNGLDEGNAREPNVDVDMRGTNSLCCVVCVCVVFRVT